MSRAKEIREILISVRAIARRVTKLEQRQAELEELATPPELDDDDDGPTDSEDE